MRLVVRVVMVALVLGAGGAFFLVVRASRPIPYSTPPLPTELPADASADTAAFEAVLSRRLDARGRADYAAWADDAADRAVAEATMAAIAARSPRSKPAAFPTYAARVRYWIHAHAAAQIAVVLQTGAKDVATDLEAPWSSVRGDGLLRRRSFSFGGETQTLYGLPRRFLAEATDDPRVVFALGGVAKATGPIARAIPTDDASFDAFLDARVASFFADPEEFSFADDGRSVRIAPRIFWWRDLLVGRRPRAGDADGDGALLDALAALAPKDVAAKLVARPRPKPLAADADWRVR